ncbi:TetR family transcriptional regulator [Jatrophihabitans sp. GAS493]|uniref:TetR/AcrR family transcriptional regulator n=1 Tax=Jatrophihabitans sp. GAS493 TaxID=1907575 RepID=UPI000BB94B6C|nr:TetR/AcrR family transcriptional regulator [Jatrophihabitans sp. GAS493]SOD74664.1 TetR family transcriptional regulator [Jatrophihabitans sp. GAS493]
MAQTGSTKTGRRAPAPSKRTNGNGQARYDEIVQIAGALFAERGFLATTIRDIADAANILSGSLYYHFSSKESIADELLKSYWNELLSMYDKIVASKKEPTETVRELLGASILMLEKHEYAVRMILNDWAYLTGVLPYLEENMVTIRRIWTTQLRNGAKSGQFRSSLDPNLTYRTIMGSISGAGRWFEASGKVTTTQLAQEMADLFLLGLQPSEPAK